ncbi:MAG: hypothetical protein DMG57_22415 [Acidobacteria bacterium]|nr:MAG: hypothetical protein DMG57_22415 [Acidobacteriota bacterium]
MEAISGNSGTLMQVAASGGEAAAIPTPWMNPGLCDISPNRSELLVAGSAGVGYDFPLWIVPIPAGTPRRLSDLLAHAATWSPDGQQIVYARGTDLFRANSDGSNSRKLRGLAGIPFAIRWSPNESVLRFTVQDPKTNSSSLWEMSAEGTELHPLLANWNRPPDECCGEWTPNGKYFVFQATRNGVTNIWAIPEKGALSPKRILHPVALTSGPMNFLVPACTGQRR